jgi:hypothetical protein
MHYFNAEARVLNLGLEKEKRKVFSATSSAPHASEVLAWGGAGAPSLLAQSYADGDD